MVCEARSFPFGTGQTLIYYVSPTDSITVNLDRYTNYTPEGEGFLGYFGYDRWQDPDLTKTIRQSIMGSSILNGPVFRTPYKFSWQLQLLNLAQYHGLWGIYKRQQAERRAVRLCDYLLALDEAGSRNRAKCSAFPVPGAPAVSGITYFYPQFDIWLEFGQERESYNVDKFSLKFTAIEMNPATPVPVSADI